MSAKDSQGGGESSIQLGKNLTIADFRDIKSLTELHKNKNFPVCIVFDEDLQIRHVWLLGLVSNMAYLKKNRNFQYKASAV